VSHGGSISVLLNKGDGTFHSPVKYEIGTGTTSVDIGDLNEDGNLDLASAAAAADDDGYISVLLGNGDGTFQERQLYNYSGYDGWSIAIGDLDGDKYCKWGRASVTYCNLFGKDKKGPVFRS